MPQCCPANHRRNAQLSQPSLPHSLPLKPLQVILLFPSVFWGDQLDMFGHVAGSREERGEAFLFYSYTHISGGALLVGLCAGGWMGWLGWVGGQTGGQAVWQELAESA